MSAHRCASQGVLSPGSSSSNLRCVEKTALQTCKPQNSMLTCQWRRHSLTITKFFWRSSFREGISINDTRAGALACSGAQYASTLSLGLHSKSDTPSACQRKKRMGWCTETIHQIVEQANCGLRTDVRHILAPRPGDIGEMGQAPFHCVSYRIQLRTKPII